MKKYILLTAIVVVLSIMYGNVFAEDINNVLNADSIKVSVIGADTETTVKKMNNDNTDIKTIVSKKLDKYEEAVVFDLKAYDIQNEEKSWTGETLNVTVSHHDKSGISGFGKDYRIFIIQDGNFKKIEWSGNSHEISFKTNEIGTFIFIYNYKAFPVTFYSEFDAINDDNNVMFYKTEDLAAKDMVYAPKEIPQKEGYIFGGWVDTLRKDIPLTYKNYVNNGLEYCAKWISDADVQCDMNTASVDNIEFSNNNINFDKDKKVYFLDELQSGEITVTTNNNCQSFQIWANGIDVNYDEALTSPYNPQNITFTVPQNNSFKRIDIVVFSVDYTNVNTYSFIVGDDTAEISALNESVLTGNIKGYSKSVYNADNVVRVDIETFEPETKIEYIDFAKNKCLGFVIEPIGEYENLIGYTKSEAPDAKLQVELTKVDGSVMGTNYKIYKLSGSRVFEQEVCISNEKSVSFYADGYGTFILAYEPENYDVTYISDGNVYQLVNVEKGHNVTLPAAPQKSGYTFKGWYSEANGQGTALSDTDVINEYKTVYAYWQKNSNGGSGISSTYSVKFNTNGGSELKNISVKRNAIINEPDIPSKDGYRFEGWYIDSKCTNKFDFTTKITKSITLHAKWSEISIWSMILKIDDKQVTINDKIIVNDVAPIIRNNRTFTPARLIAESLGATVRWNEAEQLVVISLGNTVIKMTIGSKIAYVNDRTAEMDTAPFIENERTFTPSRFIVENLGAKITWDETNEIATITK